MRKRDGRCRRGQDRADERQGKKPLYLVVIPKRVMALNFAAIILEIVGTPSSVVGVPVHNAGSILLRFCTIYRLISAFDAESQWAVWTRPTSRR